MSRPSVTASRYTVEVEWAPYASPDASGAIDLSQAQTRQVVVEADTDADATLQAAQIASGVAPGWNERPGPRDYPTNPVVPRGSKGMVTRTTILRMEAAKTAAVKRPDLYGANDLGRMFGEDTTMAPVPWEQVGRTKTHTTAYDRDAIWKVLRDPEWQRHVKEFDPRDLYATQGLLRADGMRHYMSPEYEQTGKVFADADQVANQVPIVYVRADGKKIIVTGHHRAAAALLKGKPHKAIEVHEPAQTQASLLPSSDAALRHADALGGRRGAEPLAHGTGEHGGRRCASDPGRGSGGAACRCLGDGRRGAGLLGRGAERRGAAHRAAGLADLDDWRPTRGMFSLGEPTLDPRVFDLTTEQMHPQIRESVVKALDDFWRPKYGDWQQWAKPYLAGSGASHWWDSDRDMDILVGVDLDRLRDVRPQNQGVPDDDIVAHLDAQLKNDLDPLTAHLNGFETTYFVNAGSYDIRDIKPYAAYDLLADDWVVYPPVLPSDWGPQYFPDDVWRMCAQQAREADTVLALPDPAARHQACVALFDRWHSWRHLAYTESGKGWLDTGNVNWQYQSQRPDRTLARLYAEKHNPVFDTSPQPVEAVSRTAGAEGGLPEGLTIEHQPGHIANDRYVIDAIYARHHGKGVGLLTWMRKAHYPGGADDEGIISNVHVVSDYQRRGIASAMFAKAREIDPRIRHSDSLSDDAKAWIKGMGHTAALTTRDYEGRVDDPSHITRVQTGTVPTEAIAHLNGKRGETPGAHRNRQGEEWEEFKRNIATNGIQNPIFICVDPGDEPRIYEGNHRRDAAVELGLPEVPVEICYFGHAERHHTVASAGLAAAVAEFKADWGSGLSEPDVARDMCKHISQEFVRTLADHGIHGELVSGVRYGDFMGQRVVEQGHFAVRVGDEVYDWTIRQFDRRAQVPTVTSYDDWRGRWEALGKMAARREMDEDGVHYEVSFRHDPNGEPVERGSGEAWIIPTINGNPIGGLRWNYLEEPPVVMDVQVDPEYQRRGIASRMWELAKENESQLQHSTSQTPEGREWARAVGAAKTAGPVRDRIIPAMRRAISPGELRKPRPVVLDRGAEDDLKKLPGDVRNALVRAVEAVEDGKADLEAKARSLAGAYSVRLSAAWRALFYLGQEMFWHLWCITDHDYDEAVRRWGVVRGTTTYARLVEIPAPLLGGSDDGLLAMAGMAELRWLWSVPGRPGTTSDGARLVMGAGEWPEAAGGSARPLRVLHALLCAAGPCACGDPTGERAAQRLIACGTQLGEDSVSGGAPVRHDGRQGWPGLSQMSGGSNSEVSRATENSLTDHDYDEVQRRFAAAKPKWTFTLDAPPHPMGRQYDHLMAKTLNAYNEHGEHSGLVEFGPDEDTKEILIQGLSVHPDERGKGLASELMDKVVREHLPPGWRIYHGTRTEDAQRWWKHYRTRPGFDPAQHTDAYERAGITSALTCPQGHAAEMDPIDGLQHPDGSVAQDCEEPGQFPRVASGQWDRSGDEPRWVQPHHELLQDALWSLKGSPSTMSIHMHDALAGAPQPSSGSGKQMRAQAEALIRELRESAQPNPVHLYRGDHRDPAGVQAWSEDRDVAEQWARKGGGKVHVLKPGEAKGIRIADHISSGLDALEKEWVIDSGPGRTTAKDKRFDGVGLDQDDDGWFIKTHRARSDSYPSPEKIPDSAIEFIRSTGKQVRNMEPGETIPASRTYSGEDETIADIVPGSKWVKVETDGGEAPYAFTPKTVLSRSSRAGIEYHSGKPNSRGGMSGVVREDRGPQLAYRGFGSWDEARDALKRGHWMSNGTFSVPGEGRTQMALRLGDVVSGSGHHWARGSGFVGAVEADVSGLPFDSIIQPGEADYAEDAPRVTHNEATGEGRIHPNLGLGIGVDSIPMNRVRRVYVIDPDNKKITDVIEPHELADRLPQMADHPDWYPEVSHKPETKREWMSWTKGGIVHSAPDQSTTRCGKDAYAVGGSDRKARIQFRELMRGVTNHDASNLKPEYKQERLGPKKKLQPCPKCFPDPSRPWYGPTPPESSRRYYSLHTASTPRLRIYHGTNSAALEQIQRDGEFRPLDVRRYNDEVAREYGIDPEKLWHHPRQQFTREAREDDDATHFTSDPEMAREYARLGSEVMSATVGSASEILHPGDREAQRRMVAEHYKKHGIHPVMLTLDVPADTLTNDPEHFFHDWRKDDPEHPGRYIPLRGQELVDKANEQQAKGGLGTMRLRHIPSSTITHVEHLPLHPQLQAALNPDEIPKPPGETPLPPGTVRAFHYTDSANVPSILQHGLQMQHARGERSSEPNAIWFSGRNDYWREGVPGKSLVEMALPADEQPALGGHQGNFAYQHDISPEHILAVHHPWHGRYRYFRDNGMTDAVKRGEYDDLASMPDYGEAIQRIKRESSMLRTVATDTETFWHVTDKPDFALDPEHKPAGAQDEFGDMTYRHEPGFFVTDNPELWRMLWKPLGPAYGVEVEVPRGTAKRLGLSTGDDRDQWHIKPADYDKVRIKRVVPIDVAIKEAKAHGKGFALVGPDEVPGGGLHIINHHKGWGSPDTYCGGYASGGGEMAKWTTVQQVRTDPVLQRHVCKDCIKGMNRRYPKPKPVKVTAGLQIREDDHSPLSYPKYRVNKRLSIIDGDDHHPDADIDAAKAKQAEKAQAWRAANPRRRLPDRYKPENAESWVKSGFNYFTRDNSAPGTTAFIDLQHEPEYKRVEIAYMAVRPDQRRKGLSRKLIEEVYRRHPGHTIHWGQMMQPEVGHLYDDMKEKHPEQTGGGSRWY